MKIREDFVTNSSSSSFILICKDKHISVPGLYSNVFVIGKKGNLIFDKELAVFTDTYDKINFIAIAAIAGEFKESVLNDVLMDVMPNVTDIDWSYINDQYCQEGAYIDHQCLCQGNLAYLYTKSESLKRFLFNDKSKLIMSLDGNGEDVYVEDAYNSGEYLINPDLAEWEYYSNK
jgi:hypothetical protein